MSSKPVLYGRVALVTGASRGIGLEVARSLARAGARVALAARDAAALEEALGDPLLAEGRAFPVDLADAAAARALVARVEEAFGRLDVLVNNAGIAVSAPLHRSDDALWDRTFALNLFAPFVLSRAAAVGMRARRWGRIVNVASTAALKGYAYTAAYTASKHALLGLTRAQAQAWIVDGVTVNAVCPGFVDTPMTQATLRNIIEKTGKDHDAALAELVADARLGRLITREEVAAAVMSFLGPHTDALTAQALAPSGGATEGS